MAFFLGDRHVFPKYFPRDGTIQIHIHDVPVWISDSNVSCVLSAYGKVVGNIRHGKRKLQSGAFMSTGVRFATFEPKRGTTLPRTLCTSEGSHTFRVIREGEPPSCNRCGSFFHASDECRKKPKKTSTTSTTDATHTQNLADDRGQALSPRRWENPRREQSDGRASALSSEEGTDSEGFASESEVDEDKFESSNESLEHDPPKPNNVTVNPRDTGEVTPGEKAARPPNKHAKPTNWSNIIFHCRIQ